MYKLPNFLSTNSSVSWRWMLALLAIGCGVTGFVSGVGVTERDLSDAMFGTHLYNTLGLFILGGMDLGTPQGGPLWGRALLWFSYFAAPLVTGSTIVDWVHRILHQQHVFLRRLRDHIVLIGTEEVAHSILKKIRSLDREVQVLVVEIQ